MRNCSLSRHLSACSTYCPMYWEQQAAWPWGPLACWYVSAQAVGFQGLAGIRRWLGSFRRHRCGRQGPRLVRGGSRYLLCGGRTLERIWEWVKTQTAKTERTLVFAIASLNLLVDILLDLSFENARSCGFVKAGSLQDVCRIDPVVMAPAHNMLLEVISKLVLVNWDLWCDRQRLATDFHWRRG